MLFSSLGLDQEKVVYGFFVVPVTKGAEKVPVVGVSIAWWGDGCFRFDLLFWFLRRVGLLFFVFLALLFHFFDDPIFAVAHVLLFWFILTTNQSFIFISRTIVLTMTINISSSLDFNGCMLWKLYFLWQNRWKKVKV